MHTPSTDNEKAAEFFDKAAIEGIQRAGDALTGLFGRTVEAKHLGTEIVESVGSTELVQEKPTDTHAAVGFLAIAGAEEIAGHGFVMLSQKSIDDLMGGFGLEPEPDGSLGEMGESMLREFANITASSYLNAISDAIGKSLEPTPVSLNLIGSAEEAKMESYVMGDHPGIIFRCECVGESNVSEVAMLIVLGSSDITALIPAGGV